MLRLDTKARLECDEPGCEESVQVRLIVTVCGAYSPDLPAHARGWQVLGDPNNPMAPIRGRCLFHAQKANSKIIMPGISA
jgi:hypothetical protein